MHETARSLKDVLSSSGTVRGRWGEAVLKTLLEESGFTEGINFHVQETIEGEGSALRPDVIIDLPGGFHLAVDSKASLEQFFKVVEETDIDKKQEHTVLFTQNIRRHVQALASKEYQKHLDPKIPYVIMFIPGEAAVRTAFEHDTTLYQDAQSKKVLISSPATIMPMILLIAHAWKQHKSIENASKIMVEIAVLGDRLKTFSSHLGGIGSALSGAVKMFNSAVGSWDLRVHPQIEKIATIGGNLNLDSNLSQIEEEPRLPQKTLPSKSK
jgi:DNA recombination protein RmuC